MGKSILEGDDHLNEIEEGNHNNNNNNNINISNGGIRKQKRRLTAQTIKAREVIIRGRFMKVWARDEDFKACFLCRKEFNFLFRRKHHCRKCGQVFCSNCSDYFLSRLVNLSSQKLDKNSRLCQTCYLECKEFLEADLNHDSENSEESSSSEDEGEESGRPAQSRQALRADFREKFETRLRQLIQFVFSQEKKLSNVPQFSQQYVESTLEFSLFCLKRLRLRARRISENSNHNNVIGNSNAVIRREKFHELDINRYVMIKTCLHKDANTFRFINGIINSKNVAKKNMQITFGLRRELSTSQLQSFVSIPSPTPTSNRMQFSQSAFDFPQTPGTNAPAAATATAAAAQTSSNLNPQQQEVRCLVIGVSVDIFSNSDANYPDLQQIILKQRTYMQKIVEGIKMQRPQIIFCRENVNQDVLQTLESANITVVQKVKHGIIQKIAEVARCQVIEDISLLFMTQTQQVLQNHHNHHHNHQHHHGNHVHPHSSGHHSHNSLKHSYIGYLQSAYFKSFSFATQHKSYMFLEQPEKSSAHHVSLLITGPQLEILKQFKKSLQVILRLAKHLYLEQEIVYMSNEMLKGSRKARKLLLESLESDYVDFGNLNNFLDEKMGLHEYLQSDLNKFQFVKIQYKKVEWSSFKDVNSKAEFDKYVLEKKINYDTLKVNAVVKNCGDFEQEHVSFYQVKDISLAEFLMNIISKRDTSCGKCKRPMYNHVQLYMRSKSYIRVNVVGRMDPHLAITNNNNNNPLGNGNPNPQSANSNGINSSNSGTSSVPASVSTTTNASTKSTSPNTKHPQQGNSSTLRTPHRAHDHRGPGSLFSPESNNGNTNGNSNNLNTNNTPSNNNGSEDTTPKRRRINPKEEVLTYILCEQCHKNLTSIQRVSIGKTFMEYSYHRFLQHLFAETSETYKREKINRLRDMRETKDFGNLTNASMLQTTAGGNISTCSHQIRCRVFNIKDVEIKFSVGRTLLYGFKWIFFASEAVAATVREADAHYYKEKYVHLKTQFKAVLLDATSRFHKLLEVINSKKHTQKSQYFLAIQESYKNYLLRMEAEREYVIANTDASKITGFASLQLFYLFEQRLHIGISRLVNLQKEVIKKKYKTFARQTMTIDVRERDREDAQSIYSHPELDTSLLDDELQEIQQNLTFKELKEVINVQQEEKCKDPEVVQPFEYLPIYAKSHFSKITWALNTKAHVKFLKDSCLEKAHTLSKSFLMEYLRKQAIEAANSDEKQVIEDSKLVIRIMKCADFESLTRHDNTFANSTLDGVSSAYLNTLIGGANSNQSLLINANQSMASTVMQDYNPQTDQSDDAIESDLLVQQTTPLHTSTGTTITVTQSQTSQAAKETMEYNGRMTVMPSMKQSKTMESQKSDNSHSHNNNNLIIPSTTSQPPLRPHSNTAHLASSSVSESSLNTSTTESNQNGGSNNTSRDHQNNTHAHIPQKHRTGNLARQSMSSLVTNQSQQQQNALMSDLQGDYNFLKMTMLSRSTNEQFHSNQLQSSSSIQTQTSNQQLPSGGQSNNNNTMGSGSNANSSTTPTGTSNQFGGHSEKLCEVVILFARQFEAIRSLYGISLERIIESLRTCSVVKLPGGQTQSVFVKSHDDLFVVKGVSELEFHYFLSFAPQYFEYLSQHMNSSLLAKVYGMFQLRVDGEDHYYSVMENLFFAVDKETSASYDLKGSKLKRFTAQNNGIGLDTNLMIDQNCEPFFIDNSSFQAFDKTIRADSDFLAQHLVVDYSLLLIVDRQKRQIRLGIIDYFRIFDWKKQVENRFKEFIKGDLPTIVPPQVYQDRFVKTITKRFFCKV